jgi:class 3 adenylate cyclase
MDRPETRYARSGDIRIAYQVVGGPGPDLILSTGFVSHVEQVWDMPRLAALYGRLAEFSRLILYDKREQGLSDRVGRPPTLEEMVDDLSAVLLAAGSDQAAVMGISEGGPTAILFAASHPERCSHLILWGSYARLAWAEDYPDGLPVDALIAWGEGIEEQWGGPVGIELFAPSWAGDPGAEADWAQLLRVGTSPRGAAALMGLYREIDARGALPLVSTPTLVMHPSEDRVIPPALGRYVADAIDGARFVEFPGQDHLLHAADFEPIVEEIEEFITGTRSSRPSERVLATVLFTDIVGSTERAAELGDREWRRLLDRHDELTRDEIERHQGRAVKSTGDGFLAAFDGPGRAIHCAESVVDRVRGLEIEVRAGLHTGECEIRNGDMGGLAVHIGARVAARADAGEVLVSGTVKDLVVGSGIEFEDRGSAELKGVPGSWRLFAVRP